jgi:hypothetical protein
MSNFQASLNLKYPGICSGARGGMGMEFQVGRLRKFCRWMVVMATQPREWI